MNDMNLQTKIRFKYIPEHFSIIQLKDGYFALYSKEFLILFDNNLFSKIVGFYDDNSHLCKDLKSVKQLKNGQILCCNQYLFLINNDINSYEVKKIEISKKEKNEKLFDVVELDNGTIIGITIESLYNIKIKDEYIVLTQIHKIPEDWLVSWEEKYCYNGELNIFDLKNNKILLHSHSYRCIRRCLFGSATIKKESKIFIVDLNNFEVVYTENFPNIANIVVLKDYICVYHSKTIFIYSINDYKILQKFESNLQSINIYNDNFLIVSNKVEGIILYNLTDLNNIEYQIFISKFVDIYDISLCKLDDKRIIIVSWDNLYIAELPDKFNFKPISFTKKRNTETNDEK